MMKTRQVNKSGDAEAERERGLAPVRTHYQKSDLYNQTIASRGTKWYYGTERPGASQLAC